MGFDDVIGQGVQAMQAYAAVDEALGEMRSMCANAGQEAIISSGTDSFEQWASDAISNASDPDGGTDIPDLESYLELSLDDDQLDATDEIWAVGQDIVLDAIDEELLDEGDDDQGEIGFSEAPSVDFIRFRGETPAEEEKRRRQYERDKTKYNWNRGNTRFYRGAAGEGASALEGIGERIAGRAAARAAARAIARRIAIRAAARAARRAAFRR